MVNKPGGSVEGFERGKVVPCDPAVPLHVRPGQTGFELFAGTHPILRVFADENRQIVVESIETGRKYVIPRGDAAVAIGRNAPVINGKFIGANSKYASGEHCLLTITEYDQRDGHPIVQIADAGSTNGTFQQMLVKDSASRPKAPEGASGGEYLGEYVVEPGDQVEIPLLKRNSNSYDIFDTETGTRAAQVLAGTNGVMIITSEGYKGKNVEFGNPVEVDLSAISGIRGNTALKVFQEMGYQGAKRKTPTVIFTFEGNASRPVIKNLGTRRFVAKPIPLFRPAA